MSAFRSPLQKADSNPDVIRHGLLRSAACSQADRLLPWIMACS